MNVEEEAKLFNSTEEAIATYRAVLKQKDERIEFLANLVEDAIGPEGLGFYAEGDWRVCDDVQDPVTGRKQLILTEIFKDLGTRAKEKVKDIDYKLQVTGHRPKTLTTIMEQAKNESRNTSPVSL